MFFEFASMRAYPQSLWITVWTIEVRLFATFMEEISQFRGLTPEELRTALRDAITGTNYESSKSPSLEAAVEAEVDAYLDNELGYLKAFIESGFDGQTELLYPYAEVLARCSHASSEFNNSIKCEGAKARIRMQRRHEKWG